jgi:hypothetical protein
MARGVEHDAAPLDSKAGWFGAPAIGVLVANAAHTPHRRRRRLIIAPLRIDRWDLALASRAGAAPLSEASRAAVVRLTRRS